VPVHTPEIYLYGEKRTLTPFGTSWLNNPICQAIFRRETPCARSRPVAAGWGGWFAALVLLVFAFIGRSVALRESQP
jgi:hypothetical protein